MNQKSSFAIAAVALIVSLGFVWAIFTTVKPGQDFYAYGLSLIALLLATYSAVVFYRLRGPAFSRVVFAIAVLISAFWAIEFFGGISWYLLDKIVRHYQRP